MKAALDRPAPAARGYGLNDRGLRRHARLFRAMPSLPPVGAACYQQTGTSPTARPRKERAALPNAHHRQPPTAQWLTDRYLTDRLTAEEIGELCGWSSQYIRDRLRDNGIPLRPPGTHRRIRRTLDRDTLTNWLHDGATVQQISNRSRYTTFLSPPSLSPLRETPRRSGLACRAQLEMCS